MEAIERFEQQRLAELSSLIALRLMMLTLVRPVNSGKPVGAKRGRRSCAAGGRAIRPPNRCLVHLAFSRSFFPPGFDGG